MNACSFPTLSERGGSVLRRAVAEYLEAEKRLGRVRPDADTDALATALIATVHHLLLLHGRKEDPRRDLRRIVTELGAGITPRAEPDRRPRPRATR
jgi:hypothetical protein